MGTIEIAGFTLTHDEWLSFSADERSLLLDGECHTNPDEALDHAANGRPATMGES